MGIIAFVFFYLRRQKKTKRQDNNHKHMAVSRNEINDHYEEELAYKPNFQEAMEVTENTRERYYSPTLTGATVIDNNYAYNPANRDFGNVSNAVKPSVTLVNDYATVKPDRK